MHDLSCEETSLKEAVQVQLPSLVPALKPDLASCVLRKSSSTKKTHITKTEQTGSLRKETIKLIGVLGALDPYKYQQISDVEPDVHHINEIQSREYGT